MSKNLKTIGSKKMKSKTSTVTFNLIEYLKEVTHAETEYIEQVCKEINIRIDQRPHSAVLDSLLNRIIGEDISNPVPVKSVNKEFPEEITYNSEDSNLSSVLDGAEELESSSDDTEIVDNSIIEIPNNSFSNSIIMLDNQSTPIITTKVPVSNSNFASVPCSSKSEETNESKTKETVVDQKLVLRLREMFPQASPGYISEICKDRVWDQFDEIVEIILSNPEHPKRPEKQPSPPPEIDPEDQYEIVKALLPDADPTYLRMQCEAMEYDPTKLTEFVNRANELKTYPTMKEYLRKQKFTAQSKQYTTDFQVAKFVELFPDPEKTFNDPNRTIKLDVYKEQYIYQYFGNKFDKIQKKVIWTTLLENKFNVITTNKKLNSYLKKNQEKTMKCRRKHVNSIEHVQDILLLQELAYLDHKKEIEKFIEERKKKDEEDFNYAKENQLLNACQCCYDEEVMPKNTFYCPEGHKFCKDCMTKSCEVALGDGKTDFKCMIECDEEFTLSTLQLALPPKMFSKLAQKKQLAEVKAAGLQELEFCPFCDFASIPDESDKIFRCLNPECMKESCRKCKEPNHIPLSCEEVEKDEEVKTRTYIENKMTEALLRKCWKCEKSFFKEEGCNKMTCTCGATMCYICQKPVKDYSHFNGLGGENFHLCPLYSDTNAINKDSVLKAAQAAKAEVDATKLKVDPTADVAKHFDERKKTLPQEPHMNVLQNQQHVGNDNHRIRLFHQNIVLRVNEQPREALAFPPPADQRQQIGRMHNNQGRIPGPGRQNRPHAHQVRQLAQAILQQARPLRLHANQARPHAHQARPHAHQAQPHAHQARPHANQAQPHAHQARPHAHQAEPHVHNWQPNQVQLNGHQLHHNHLPPINNAPHAQQAAMFPQQPGLTQAHQRPQPYHVIMANLLEDFRPTVQERLEQQDQFQQLEPQRLQQEPYEHPLDNDDLLNHFNPI